MRVRREVSRAWRRGGNGRTRRPDAGPRLDHVLDRRPRGARARGRMAPRRGQARRRRDPVLLLRAEARRARGRVPHVHGRGRGNPEAADLLLDAGQGRDGGPHPDRPGEARAERGGRVPARQPPARLPGLRQGRRVPAAGHLLRLGPGPQPVRRGQAELPQADRAVAADRDRPRALHPLLPLRALLAGGRRGRPARVPRARRPHLRGDLRRPSLRGAVLRERDRAVPGRRAHQHRLPLPRTAVGHRGRGTVCTLCPSQCNVEFTVRDERVERVLARDNHDVDDGWLCDKGRWGYQAIASRERITQPLVRDGGHAAPHDVGAGARRGGRGTAQGGAASRALVGGSATNEEGYLAPAHLPRGARLAARRLPAGGGLAPARSAHARASRPRAPRSATSTAPRPCWCSSPTPSTRRRSSTCGCARRCAASARAWWSLERPDRARRRRGRGAAFAPGAAEALLRGAPEGAGSRPRARPSNGGAAARTRAARHFPATRSWPRSLPTNRSTGSRSAPESTRTTCATPPRC